MVIPKKWEYTCSLLRQYVPIFGSQTSEINGFPTVLKPTKSALFVAPENEDVSENALEARHKLQSVNMTSIF